VARDTCNQVGDVGGDDFSGAVLSQLWQVLGRLVSLFFLSPFRPLSSQPLEGSAIVIFTKGVVRVLRVRLASEVWRR
jgi:hypothetical protein